MKHVTQIRPAPLEKEVVGARVDLVLEPQRLELLRHEGLGPRLLLGCHQAAGLPRVGPRSILFRQVLP